MLGDNEVDVGKTKDVAHRVEAGWLAGRDKVAGRVRLGVLGAELAGAVESERCVFTGFRRCEHIDMMNTKTRASPVIWRIYLEFEVRTGDLERAKGLLYRAMGECPFHKGLSGRIVL